MLKSGVERRVAAFLRRDDEVLLRHVPDGRAPGTGVWELPLTRVSANETVDDAIARELWEGLNMFVVLGDRAPVLRVATATILTSVFEFASWAGDFDVPLTEEHADVQWVTRTHVDDLSLGPIANYMLLHAEGNRFW